MPFNGGQTALILFALLNQDRTPLEILEAVNAETGRKTLSRGSIYVLMGRLEDSGLVRSHEVPAPEGRRGGRPSRRYELTAEGASFATSARSLLTGVTS